MNDKQLNCKSDIWIPEIKKLCKAFLKNIKNYPGGKYLCFRDDLGSKENPGIIVKEYHNSVAKLKKEIFSANNANERIDYHKITALYIRSFLKFQPFYLDKPERKEDIEMCLYTKCPNEYFVLLFLEAMFKAWNNDVNGFLIMDPSYQADFIKLLYHYKKNISKLDPVSFSNTVYLIEQQYFKNSWSNKKFEIESYKWIPEIEKLCLNFLTNMQKRPGGNSLCFNYCYLGTMEKPGEIVKEFLDSLNWFKKEIYNIKNEEVLVDYHKIIALYIRSFLKYEPFYFDVHKDAKSIKKKPHTEFPNEYFILPFLETMFKVWNNDFNNSLRMDSEYQKEFIQLLSYYRQDINKFEVVTFSNTIFFIEQHYFHSEKKPEESLAKHKESLMTLDELDNFEENMCLRNSDVSIKDLDLSKSVKITTEYFEKLFD